MADRESKNRQKNLNLICLKKDLGSLFLSNQTKNKQIKNCLENKKHFIKI